MSQIASGIFTASAIVDPDLPEEEDTKLEFYNEHPDQAKSKLYQPRRIESLRNGYLDYINARDIGPKFILLGIEGRILRWARPEFVDHVSKALNKTNLQNFKDKKSNLVMPSRLLVHIYVWTSHEPYRKQWGEFLIHPKML